MNLLNLIAAVLFIVLAVLVRKFPNLIAGYNDLSIPEKKELDEKALINFIQTILFGLSGLNLLIIVVSISLDLPKSVGAVFFKYSTLGGVIFALLYVNFRNFLK